MAVKIKEGFFLFLHRAQDEAEHGMFEHVGVVAGVKAVAIAEHRFDIYLRLNESFINADAVVRPCRPRYVSRTRGAHHQRTNNIETPGQRDDYIRMSVKGVRSFPTPRRL